MLCAVHCYSFLSEKVNYHESNVACIIINNAWFRTAEFKQVRLDKYGVPSSLEKSKWSTLCYTPRISEKDLISSAWHLDLPKKQPKGKGCESTRAPARQSSPGRERRENKLVPAVSTRSVTEKIHSKNNHFLKGFTSVLCAVHCYSFLSEKVNYHESNVACIIINNAWFRTAEFKQVRLDKYGVPSSLEKSKWSTLCYTPRISEKDLISSAWHLDLPSDC